MSKYSMEKIICPKCNCESNFKISSSINTVLNPDMYEKVRTGEAFTLICPDCGNKTYIDYGFLYHQMDDRMMIYYIPEPAEVEKAYNLFRGNDAVAELLGDEQEKYLYRIVESKLEFREKLYIFDAGLDDRAIEVIKLFYTQKFMEDNPKSNLEEVIFSVQDNGKYIILFLVDGRPVATSEIDIEFYNMVMEDYISKLPDIKKDEIIINFQWAIKFLNNKEQ